MSAALSLTSVDPLMPSRDAAQSSGDILDQTNGMRSLLSNAAPLICHVDIIGQDTGTGTFDTTQMYSLPGTGPFWMVGSFKQPSQQVDVAEPETVSQQQDIRPAISWALTVPYDRTLASALSEWTASLSQILGAQLGRYFFQHLARGHIYPKDTGAGDVDYWIRMPPRSKRHVVMKARYLGKAKPRIVTETLVDE